MLFAKYGGIYQTYLRKDFRDDLLNAFEAETDPSPTPLKKGNSISLFPFVFYFIKISNLISLYKSNTAFSFF